MNESFYSVIIFLSARISSLIGLKQANSDLKLLAAIGGANDELAQAFSQLSRSSSTRLVFANNVKALVELHSLDGIDIDYEFPSADDRDNFVLLLQDLREAFRGSNHILSIAVAPDKWRAQAFYDIPKISATVDFINLMTYDFHGSWSEAVGHHAQMYPLHTDSSYMKELNCAASVTFWLSNGAPPEKLILGIPTYGNTFVLSDSKIHKIGSPVNVTETKQTRGNMGYNEYCSSSGWKQNFDRNHRVYYAVNGFSWFGFNGVGPVITKAKFIKKYDLGGAMIWSIDTDDYGNVCGQGRFPLISSVSAELNKE